MTALMDLTEDEWDLVLDVNLKGMFLVTQVVAPGDRPGRWWRRREHVDD
jgi:NAD(P)-dependent dehydrogenase (short-subunit alcohol dehydrogenase family)